MTTPPMHGTGACTVLFFAGARAAVGVNELTVLPGSLADVLAQVTTSHPDFARVQPACSYLIDGLAVHGYIGDAIVPDGACVDVLPPFAGG